MSCASGVLCRRQAYGCSVDEDLSLKKADDHLNLKSTINGRIEPRIV